MNILIIPGLTLEISDADLERIRTAAGPGSGAPNNKLAAVQMRD